MKNERLLELVDLADDELLLDAAESRPRQHRRKRVGAIMIAAAAALAMTVTAGGIVISKRLGNKQDVSVYYTESMAAQLEEGGYAVGATSENEHFRITLNTWVIDEYCGNGVLTVEPKDEAARAFIDRVKSYGGDYDAIDPLVYDRGGQLITDKNGLVGLLTGDTNSDARSFELMLYPNENGLDLDKYGYDLTVRFCEFGKYNAEDMGKAPSSEPDLFEGISFDLSLEPNVDCITLRAESGHELKLSQVGFAAQVNRLEFDNGYEYPEEMLLSYSDGQAARLTLTDQLTKQGGDFDVYMCDETDIIGGFMDKLIRIEGLRSVEYAGEVYKAE